MPDLNKIANALMSLLGKKFDALTEKQFVSPTMLKSIETSLETIAKKDIPAPVINVDLTATNALLTALIEKEEGEVTIVVEII